MKIKELIAELQKLDQEKEVLVSKDPEGNSFRTIDGVDNTYTKYAIIYPTDDLIDL